MSKQIIAVVGATGNQGSSVAKTFLSLPNWHVRALTRDPSSPSAQSLASLGAEVVRADLADRASLEAAFAGCAAIFLNTDFWAPYVSALKSGQEVDAARRTGYDTEILHARNAVDAAAATPGLRRLVYSALGPMSRASGGKYSHCYHWETKNDTVDYIESTLPELAARTSYMYPTIYHQNNFLFPKRDAATGEYVLHFPGPSTTRLQVIAASRSSGAFVRALVEDEPAGTRLCAYNADVTIDEAVAAWSRVTGVRARFQQVTYEEMGKISGLIPEVLDGAGFLGEHDFMAGVAGGRVVESGRMDPPLEAMSYDDVLRLTPVADLLSFGWPKF